MYPFLREGLSFHEGFVHAWVLLSQPALGSYAVKKAVAHMTSGINGPKRGGKVRPSPTDGGSWQLYSDHYVYISVNIPSMPPLLGAA